MILRKDLLAAILAVTAAAALRAAPYVPALSPSAYDLGDCAAVEGTASITLTVALTPRNTHQRGQSRLEQGFAQPHST
jgi:hypothetical protein